MGDFPIIWLLVNTKTGRVILGLIVVAILVAMFGWWLVPIVAGLIGGFLVYYYYDEKKCIREGEKLNKTGLIWGLSILVFAGLFALGLHLYENREWPFYDNSYYERPIRGWEMEDIPDSVLAKRLEEMKALPDTAAVDEPPTARQKTQRQSSYSRSYDDYDDEEEDEDGMRGFDPASEDDLDDNGMDRYMEEYDDEGWE